MSSKKIYLFITTLILAGCNQENPINPEYIAEGFNFPVGKSDAIGYRDAQPFGNNYHLGSDWNGVGGGNSDLKDPIYAIADGFVKYAKKGGASWGNVIRIVHTLPNGEQYESLYAHCDRILVKKKTWVRKGQKIGTIGTASGKYLAHLHFEIRNNIYMGIGKGYSKNTKGYINPTKFINSHRKIIKY